MEKQLYALGISADGIHVYKEVDSTNLAAIRHARERTSRTVEVFLAEAQSAGRGRLGRSFVSKAGEGIYLSLLIPADGNDAASLTPLAAVAISRALHSELGIKVGIKWVNDIYLSGKKLCGILVEAVTSPDGKITDFVIGMGINVYKNAISPEISDIATSLENNGIFLPDKTSLVSAVIREILCEIKNPSPERLLAEYRDGSILIGADITVCPVSGDEYRARVIGINDDFTLKVEGGDGVVRNLFSGEVKIRIFAP